MLLTELLEIVNVVWKKDSATYPAWSGAQQESVRLGRHAKFHIMKNLGRLYGFFELVDHEPKMIEEISVCAHPCFALVLNTAHMVLLHTENRDVRSATGRVINEGVGREKAKVTCGDGSLEYFFCLASGAGRVSAESSSEDPLSALEEELDDFERLLRTCNPEAKFLAALRVFLRFHFPPSMLEQMFSAYGAGTYFSDPAVVAARS